MKWQDAKILNLEYNIANINRPIFAPTQGKKCLNEAPSNHIAIPHESWLLESLNTPLNSLTQVRC